MGGSALALTKGLSGGRRPVPPSAAALSQPPCTIERMFVFWTVWSGSSLGRHA